MSYIVNTDGWQVVVRSDVTGRDETRALTLGETVPDDVLAALGENLEPFLDGGYMRVEGGDARVPVSPITGAPVADAPLPQDQSEPAAE